MNRAEKIRESLDEFKEAQKEGWDLKPIRTWGGYEYIVLSPIDLKPGPQQVEVIDITDDQDIARFSGDWPEQSNQPVRDYALVLYGGEGGVFVMTGGEYLTDTRAVTALLSIRVEPGTVEDRRQVRQRLQANLNNANEISWPLER